MHIDNRNILVLGEESTKGWEGAEITAEAKYPINFAELEKGFVLSLHYNGNNSFLFVNSVKIYQFKAEDADIKPYPLCLGNISKDLTLDNIEKNRIKRKCRSFFCYYDPIINSDIIDIHRYLMIKT